MSANQLELIQSFNEKCQQSWLYKYRYFKGIFPELTEQVFTRIVRPPLTKKKE